MHVAIFSDQHPATLGGQQVSVRLQREFLQRAGHTVTVVAPRSPRSARDDAVVALPAVPLGGGYGMTVAGTRADRAVDRGFAARPPMDVVHVQADFWGAWTGYRFARRHDLPVVHTVHTNVEVGLPAVVPFPGPVLRLMYAEHRRHLRCEPVTDVAGYVRAFADAADALVAPSSHFADHLAGYGVTRPVHVIPTGVDDRVADALREEPAQRHDRPVLVWPGRVSREKRLDELVRAFADARVDAELHVYGSGSDLGRCRTLAGRLGVAERVRFHGAVSHDAVLRAMRHADAVVQSSLGYETQGLTLYEAVALGTPVLVRDKGIARDIPERWRHTVADDGVPALTAAVRSLVAALAAPGPPDRPSGLFVQSRLTEQMLDVYRTASKEHRVA
ncbi:glycosyltransferase [Pseudonocardia nematodicida]|uniref:Glycosyltransferase n=1 Tax=Pseudonocardia nematodicida TaxID=1206997 RepID=A0ABV1K301_9PSEU